MNTATQSLPSFPTPSDIAKTLRPHFGFIDDALEIVALGSMHDPELDEVEFAVTLSRSTPDDVWTFERLYLWNGFDFVEVPKQMERAFAGLTENMAERTQCDQFRLAHHIFVHERVGD